MSAIRYRTSLCLVTVAALVALAGTHAASAAAVKTSIEIDGNYTDDSAPGEDWFPGFPPGTDPIGTADDTLCGTSPSPKDDITHYFLTNNNDFLFVGLERLANNGQTSFFLSFDITGDGPSKGDFIFVFCFGSGSRVTDTYVLEWDDVRKQFVRDTTPPTIQFMVNTTRVAGTIQGLRSPRAAAAVHRRGPVRRGLHRPLVDRGLRHVQGGPGGGKARDQVLVQSSPPSARTPPDPSSSASSSSGSTSRSPRTTPAIR